MDAQSDVGPMAYGLHIGAFSVHLALLCLLPHATWVNTFWPIVQGWISGLKQGSTLEQAHITMGFCLSGLLLHVIIGLSSPVAPLLAARIHTCGCCLASTLPGV